MTGFHFHCVSDGGIMVLKKEPIQECKKRTKFSDGWFLTVFPLRIGISIPFIKVLASLIFFPAFSVCFLPQWRSFQFSKREGIGLFDRVGKK